MRLALAAVICALIGLPVLATVLPVGFEETTVAAGLVRLADFDWDSDGGLWLAGNFGDIWVQRGATMTQAATLAVTSAGDAGITTLRVDPDYANNSRIWVHYTTDIPTIRLAQFTNVNDVLTDEQIVFEMPMASTAYNGGCLAFAVDGTIFVGVGFDSDPASAQDPHSANGSILRLHPDGSPVAGNPFFDGTNGDPRVWAYGLRNPFRCALDPSGTLLIGDVGDEDYEEINLGVAGANFGWNPVHGPAPPAEPGMTYPLYHYEHAGVAASAVVLGDFAGPGDFHDDYLGDLLFADYSRDTIYRMRFDGGSVEGVDVWATLALRPTRVRFGPDGALYYTIYPFGQVRRIAYVGGPASGGRVDDLRLEKDGTTLSLDWSPSCQAGDDDYAVYEGTLGAFEQYAPLSCSTAGVTATTTPIAGASRFYLVAPNDGTSEGSLGSGATGEREPSPAACFARQLEPCP